MVESLPHPISTMPIYINQTLWKNLWHCFWRSLRGCYVVVFIKEIKRKKAVAEACTGRFLPNNSTTKTSQIKEYGSTEFLIIPSDGTTTTTQQQLSWWARLFTKSIHLHHDCTALHRSDSVPLTSPCMSSRCLHAMHVVNSIADDHPACHLA
jgi:hypothetical protein